MDNLFQLGRDETRHTPYCTCTILEGPATQLSLVGLIGYLRSSSMKALLPPPSTSVPVTRDPNECAHMYEYEIKHVDEV